MDDSSLDNQLRRLAFLYDEIDRVSAEVKQMNEEYDALSWKIATFMEQSGCEGKKLDGRNFVPVTKTYAKVEDKEALINWARETDSWEMVTAINAAKVNSFVNECLSNQAEIPPGVAPGFIKHSITVRKA